MLLLKVLTKGQKAWVAEGLYNLLCITDIYNDMGASGNGLEALVGNGKD